MKKRYDIIYSIGYNCACATYLRELKLRLRSGPFDWVYGPTLKERAELIARDFDGYLNFGRLEKRETSNLEHDLYFDALSKTFFVHDFPPGIPAEKSFPSVKEKYDRRIARFLADIRNSRRALLVYFSIQETTPVTTREEILEAKRILDEKFDPAKIDLWVFTHDPETPKNRIEEDLLAPGLRLYHGDIRLAQPRDEMDVLVGRKDLCLPIFRQAGLPLSAELNVKFRRTLNNLRNALINLRCAFILDKEKRKARRRKMRSGFFGD